MGRPGENLDSDVRQRSRARRKPGSRRTAGGQPLIRTGTHHTAFSAVPSLRKSARLIRTPLADRLRHRPTARKARRGRDKYRDSARNRAARRTPGPGRSGTPYRCWSRRRSRRRRRACLRDRRPQRRKDSSRAPCRSRGTRPQHLHGRRPAHQHDAELRRRSPPHPLRPRRKHHQQPDLRYLHPRRPRRRGIG
ncbi:hypothetical protein MCA2759 [Methylococcus capsulatus str. Bath]|uniref:Uncharacterized protein n=1 Tax=Methylococcus capsulatus (strain ATCC 33009 / NCIMB 11132 / Bath) TaxID=243233 RepID=Q603P4_METCA|nr:hypothetical protein MCA2759 [Methylococcus capsulatus str. Bath]